MSDLHLRLLTDLGPFKQAMNDAIGSVRNAASGLAQQFRLVGTEADNSATKASKGFDGLLGKVGGLAAAYGALRSIQALAKMSDEAALTTARIQGLTGSVEKTRAAQAALYEMSQRLQAPYQEASASFARMLPAVQQMGGGVRETTRLTEILLTTAKLSGASASEAAASAQQFAQALGSGTLAGDELKSIMENNQTLARTLAQALGVSTGELKKMGAEGKITSDVMATALLGSFDKIKAQAGEMPTTVGGAWTKIENAFGRFVQTVENGQGIFGALGKIFGEVARVIEAFTTVVGSADKQADGMQRNKGITTFAQNAGMALAMLGDMASAVVSTVVNTVTAGIKILGSLGNMIGAIGAAIELVAEGKFAAAGNVMVDAFNQSKAAVVELGTAVGEGAAKMWLAFTGAGEGAKAYTKLLADSGKAAKDTAKDAADAALKMPKAKATEEELKKLHALRMAAWEEELNQAKIAHGKLEAEQGTYNAYSKDLEVAFWQERLALATNSAIDRAAIEKRISTLQAAAIEERNKKAFDAEKKLTEQELKAGEVRAKAAAARAQGAIDSEELAAQGRLDAGRITNAQYLKLEEDFERRRYDIALGALKDAEAIALERAKVEGKDPAALAEIHAQIEALEQQHALKLQAIHQEMAKPQDGSRFAAGASYSDMLTQGAKNAFLPDVGTFESALGTMFDLTKTWQQKIQGIFSQISAVFMQKMIVEPLAEWAMRYVRETALYKMLAGQQVATQAGASAATAATKAGEATAVVSANAAEAASGAAASQSAIPIIGPALAIGAFAAIMAMVMGARSSIKSAAGGYDIPAGINPVTQLHAEEMVLPAEHANTIRELGASGGASGAVTVELKGASAGEFFIAHKSELVKAIKAAHRGFSFA